MTKWLISLIGFGAFAIPMACSSTSAAPVGDAGVAAVDGVAPTDGDAGGLPDVKTRTDSGPSGCRPQGVENFVATDPKPPLVVAGACAAGDPRDYWDFCDGSDIAKCDLLFNDNENKKACLQCLVTPASDPKWGAFIDDGDTVRSNINGCISAAGDPACAKSFFASKQCALAACPLEVCPDPSLENKEFSKCLDDALSGVCKTYADKATCAGYTDAGASAATRACLAEPSSKDFEKDTFIKVATLLCVTGK